MTVDLVPILNRDSFDALPVQAGRSTLLQCWAWGEAKAEAEGWRPRRFALAKGGTVLAAVQVLAKGPLWRVNRGPLWAMPDIPAEDKAACLAALRRAARWWKGRALLIAPEISEAEAPVMAALGFRPRPAPLWRSAWVDLFAQDEAGLRKSLNGKWRNMLVNAEKAGLEVAVIEGAAGVEWLLPRYRKMMEDKGFAGISPPVLEALARHGDLLTLTAGTDGGAVSAVLVARHGADATYLIGWNSDEGRRLRGNHLLLWRAMLELKDRGCRAFDLGGIDDVLTPGIASFKRGLNGREYALAGEFLSL